MQTYNKTGLRASLEQVETEKLDKMLQDELEKQIPDVDAVRLIVSILEERDADDRAVLADDVPPALQQYHERMKGLRREPSYVRRWMAAAASIVLVVGMLFVAVPQQAEADSFWEMLQRWSNTVLEYFSGEGKKAGMKYVFETDNLGLQQVYDAVVEMGVADPVVPMWIPEEYIIKEIGSKDTPVSKNMWAWFSSDDSVLMYKLDLYESKPAHQFYRDDSYHESYEKNGITYHITQNANWWVVVLTKDNIECLIALDCQEDTLRRILESIYVMEDS